MPPLEDARPAARRLLEAGKNGTLQLAARCDADGVLAVAILARSLARLGRPFHARFLSPVAVPEPEEEPYAGRVLIGLPPPTTGALGTLVLLDADAAAGRATPDRFVLRPGPADGPALAPVALALALGMDEVAWDSAPWALAGAYSTGHPPVGGWPQHVLGEAVKRGLVRQRPGMAVDDTPLRDLLQWSPEPLHGLLAEPDEFLRRHGLPAEASIHELDERALRTFGSAIAVAHLKAGRTPADLARLFVPCHLATKLEDTCLARVAGWFEAAACQGEAGLALGYALGDSSARAELETVQGRHRAAIRNALRHPIPDDTGPYTEARIDEPSYAETIARWVAERVRPTKPAAVVAASTEGTFIAVHEATTGRDPQFHAAALLAAAVAGAGGSSYGGRTAAVARVASQDSGAVLAALRQTPLAERAA